MTRGRKRGYRSKRNREVTNRHFLDKKLRRCYNLHMKNLPLGVQTFRDFIEHDYLYVDKTKQIYDLFAHGGKYYFFSRPRRFGKSVLISTLKEIFSGNQELFKGLWIYDKIKWIKHPVIHLDFSKITFKTPGILEKALISRIEEIALDNHIQLNNELPLKEKFAQLIKKLSQSQQQRVVILVDEYDKPMIQYVEAGDTAMADGIRNVFKNFYSVIKGSDAHLRFVFITGVSKFSRVSIFSDLNNLRDITLSSQYAVLLGYTEEELKHYFDSYLKDCASGMGVLENRLLEKIRQWYNGYSWDGENFVYNPFSIVNFFIERSFDNYWFSTGTPTFLIKIIKKQQNDLLSFENLAIKGYVFDTYDIDNIEIPVLLLQTGYLTIKKVTIKKEIKTYHLSYPNKEVQDSFLTHLFDAFTKKKMVLSTQFIERIGETIEKDDIENFIQELTSLFASIPYQIIVNGKEAYYHTVVYLVLSLSGATVRCEESTNIGRMDAVLETGKKVYIMEFKMGSAQEAMKQIKEKKYYEKYLGRGKEIILLGVGFDPEKRNIGNYELETVENL